jgi:pimeloyl-ACP methyl ester carboxylesterase
MLSFSKFKSSKTTQTPPLLILHGLFGSKQNWKSLATRLSTYRDVYAVDLRNHGDSFHSTHSTNEMVLDIESFCKTLSARPHLLGHSMGGKVVMNMLLKSRERYEKAVVVDIAPKTYTNKSLFKTYFNSMKNVDLGGDRIQAKKVLAKDIPEADIRLFLLTNLKKEDGLKWRINLKALEESMPDLWSFPAYDHSYSGDMLFIRGGLSNYITEKDLPEMKRLFPNHRLETIDGAGHWVHAEKPNEFIKLVNDYLNCH